MSSNALIPLVPEYELGPKGPPLSPFERSDEALSSKFRESFPNGTVPIKHVPHLVSTADPVEWAFETLAIFDHARVLCEDIDSLERARSALVPGPSDARGAARLQATATLLQAGLTIEQAARYVGVPLRSFCASVFDNKDSGDRHCEPAALLRVEALLRQDPSHPSLIAAETGTSWHTVNKLRELIYGPRSADKYPHYDDVRALVVQRLYRDGLKASQPIVAEAHSRWPECASWLTEKWLRESRWRRGSDRKRQLAWLTRREASGQWEDTPKEKAA